jgi:hypothetical protein
MARFGKRNKSRTAGRPKTAMYQVLSGCHPGMEYPSRCHRWRSILEITTQEQQCCNLEQLFGTRQEHALECSKTGSGAE